MKASWTTGMGGTATVEATVEEIVRRTRDEWSGEVVIRTGRFEVCVSATVAGIEVGTDYPRPVKAGEVVACIGQLGLTAERLGQVQVVIAATEADPRMVAQIASDLAADAAERAADSRARAAGLCPRCGSYCHGDCRQGR